jgi:hypothetical protein
MRKLFALLTVVFFAGFMMAQNTDTTSQTGYNNLAKTTQTGNNHAQVIQDGSLQNATVTQNGANTGGVYQLENGYKNKATLSQDGYGNEGYINQGMTQGYWSDYQAVGANYNNANMTQTGNSNFGSIEQYGGSNNTNGNTAHLTQNGSGNTSYEYQGWAYSGWGETWTTSHLQNYNSTINVTQINNNNTGNVWQYGGDNDHATISQDGNSNLAQVAQGFIYTDYAYTFTTPVYNTVNNNATITQTGDYNNGKVMQLGNNNSFHLSQSQGSWVGYDPSATGLEASRNAYFQQDGNNNRVAGVNKSGDNISFKGSADAEQINGAKLDAVSEGISGYYGSFQKGDGNTLGLRQYNDHALIQQLGNSNNAVLWQGSTAVNDATMLQNGNSNTASVLQQ